MSDEPKELPGMLELLWMLFMQPVSHYERLEACGIAEPMASAWKLWRTNGPAREASRKYVVRLMLLLLATLIFGVGIVELISLSGFAVNWHSVTLGVASIVTASGVAAGVSSAAVGVVIGVGMIVGVAPFSLLFGVGDVDVGVGVGVGTGMGMIAGVVVGLAEGTRGQVELLKAEIGAVALLAKHFRSTRSSLELELERARVLSLRIAQVEQRLRFARLMLRLAALAGVLLLAVFNVMTEDGRGAVVAGGMTAFMLSLWRLPIYPVEAVVSLLAYAAQRCLSINTLRFTPVLHHDLSYLPHPFLRAHVLLAADREPELVRRVLDACTVAPGQRRIGHNILATLQAHELEACARGRRFAILADPDLGASDNPVFCWLPSLESADPILLSFREAARYLAAAESSRPHHRLGHLLRAEAHLQTLSNALLASRSPLARSLRPTLQTWKNIVANMRIEAERAAAGFLPNPFRPGDALDPEQGSDVFRGREEIVRQIGALLADPGQSRSIALLGPRRSGKSSLLKMLPALLPDAVCIFFDLQDHPVDSAAGFFHELACTAHDQGRRDRRIDLPPLPEGGPFEAGSEWFRALDALAGDRRILFCIDEFERLESLFPGDHADLLRLMGLFRATIQHRRRLRLLVSGAAPFDELSEMWNDHFINVQELRLDLLDEATSVDLLMRPIPEFPEDAIPDPVAREVFARTGGQPLLLQACGDALVSRLNDQQSEPRRASLADLDAVQEQILQRYRPYFADTMNPKKMPPGARAALLSLAHGHTPELDTRTRRWLRQRCLLTGDDRLRVPMLGAWIREEGLDMDQ